MCVQLLFKRVLYSLCKVVYSFFVVLSTIWLQLVKGCKVLYSVVKFCQLLLSFVKLCKVLYSFVYFCKVVYKLVSLEELGKLL